MTKEVLLSLKGLQYGAEEGEEAIETITPAEYYNRNGSHYILYDEVAEDNSETTKNIIKFRDNYLEVTKKGLVNVHMVFEENKKNITNYETPYGEIIVGVDTESVKLTQAEERILVEVVYILDVNYIHMANCTISVDVRARENGGFSLQSHSI